MMTSEPGYHTYVISFTMNNVKEMKVLVLGHLFCPYFIGLLLGENFVLYAVRGKLYWIQIRKILENINDESGDCRRLEHIIEGLNSQWPAITSSSQFDAEDPGHWHAVLQTMYGIICSSFDAKQILPDFISKEVISVAQSEAVAVPQSVNRELLCY